jgi:hypothetical protein
MAKYLAFVFLLALSAVKAGATPVTYTFTGRWSTDFSSDSLGQITIGWFDTQSADNACTDQRDMADRAV